jgi:hypothetical protein
MEKLETEWIEHPVLRFDLSSVKSDELKKIESNIARQLRRYEAIYGKDEECDALSGRLAYLIEQAYTQSGRKVVVLIDEYDAPILDVLHDEEMREKVRSLLREFYSPLKECDPYLRFVFITGISMFSQLSIFSELNNLNIISNDPQYASICGITEQELLDNFQEGIEQMTQKLCCSKEETIARLKSNYDGYHFSEDSEGIFNPFSVLNAFYKNKIDSYWFSSGTPRALVEMLKTYQKQGKFTPEMLENIESIERSDFQSPLEMQTGPLPLLYQAGYLTIADYDPASDLYTLTIPNGEVRVGLMKNLDPVPQNLLTPRSQMCPRFSLADEGV